MDNSNKLIVQRGIERAELSKRLLNYFCKKEVDEILSTCKDEKERTWTDGFIVVIYENDEFDSTEVDTFTIVGSGVYDKLFQ